MTDFQTMPAPASQGTIVEQTRAVAEVAAAVRVAQDNPRSETAARSAMLETCSRLAVAERAFYEVPNRGAGPSIHLARELARIWGNLDYGVRELSRNDEEGTSEMQVWAWDQQTNARSTRSFISPHAKMVGKGADKKRQAFNDLAEIYLSNQNIGARAVRECIFALLPGWFVAEAVARCKDTNRNGDGRPLADRISDAVESFATEFKITQPQLETLIGSTVDKWKPADFARIARIYSSITIDGIEPVQFFPDKTIDLAALPTKPLDEAHPDFVADPA